MGPEVPTTSVTAWKECHEATIVNSVPQCVPRAYRVLISTKDPRTEPVWAGARQQPQPQPDIAQAAEEEQESWEAGHVTPKPRPQLWPQRKRFRPLETRTGCWRGDTTRKGSSGADSPWTEVLPAARQCSVTALVRTRNGPITLWVWPAQLPRAGHSLGERKQFALPTCRFSTPPHGQRARLLTDELNLPVAFHVVEGD